MQPPKLTRRRPEFLGGSVVYNKLCWKRQTLFHFILFHFIYLPRIAEKVSKKLIKLRSCEKNTHTRLEQ